MSNDQLSKYSAKIKDVYIELKNYKFFHSPYYGDAINNRFIGREKVKNQIISILKYTDTKSGSYLITGFRGMGKTSLIREAIAEYNAEYNQEGNENRKKTKFFNGLDDKLSLFLKGIRVLLCCILVYLFVEYLAGYSDFKQLFVLSLKSSILLLVFLGYFFFGWAYKKAKEGKAFSKYIYLLGAAAAFLIPVTLIKSAGFSWGEISLLVLLALYTFSAAFSDRVFKAAWDFFRIIFIIITFIAFGAFFLNSGYVCDKTGLCPPLVSDAMNTFFPVKAAAADSPKNNADSNTKPRPDGSDSNAESSSDLNTAAKSDGGDTKSGNDFLSTVYRIIVSILASYIFLSIVLFLLDFISLIRFRLKTIVSAPNKGGKSKKYKKFEINLSQDSLDEMDILRRMTIAIEGYWLENKFHFGSSLFNRKFYFPWRFIVSKIDRPREDDFKTSYKSVLEKLSILKNRMSGQVTTRRERKRPPNITTPIAGGLAEISMPLGAYTNNDEISYPIANAKEAEDQLREILEDIDRFRHESDWEIPEFVFIIDELDKIDPHNNSIIQERESSNPILDTSIYAEDTNRFRRRREAVGKLLANLKGFLNVARAKFFFIGGREMFDADLADIADRESFYSSIFNDVIYVESFFRDSIEKGGQGKGGMTQMTETYICNIILNDLGIIEDNKKNKLHELNLKKLHDFIVVGDSSSLKFTSEPNMTGKSDELVELRRQKYKVISTLQNYIVYLTYRSNGTPKKLNALTEQLIIKGPKNSVQNVEADNEKSSPRIEIIDNEEFFRDNVVVLHERDGEAGKLNEVDLSKRLFLKFNFNTQYELGLTSNLYRPYLIANSRHLKSLGDKLLFSSSFIIDHILKFHPFGFSWRNLELIPEVVLVNREPNLREFIEDLMRFYSLNYIRDTVSGIFDYRFRSIIRRELIHLSKTSDLSAAAFNFTLDESLSTKRHYKRKLIELRDKYANYKPIDGDNQFVHSLCFVQTILGDLHFYDKEYDEAVLFYTESIQPLRLPDAVTKRKITRHQFLLWLRNKLKLGLTLEKMRAFESAFSLYKTLILDAGRYFENIVSIKEFDHTKNDSAGEYSEEAEDYRTIHLVGMPFVALLAVTEKARNDGITYANLFTNRKDFLKTINAPQEGVEINDQKFDEYRKYYLMADYYNNVGSILYYKNCQFSRFFQNREYWLDAFDKKKVGSNQIIEQQCEIYKHEAAIDRVYDFFPSLSAFNYYWNALYFLLRYHQDRIAEQISKKFETYPETAEKIPLRDNLLALCAGYLLPECVDMVSSNRLYYIANVVSKIGDSILASLKKSEFTIPDSKFNALDITAPDEKTDKNREANIKWLRGHVGDSLFKAETVLYIYKLAAAMYKRAGHNSYYASHLIKILYVIKDLIELNKGKTETLNIFLGVDRNAKRPFQNIEAIAETVFRATTWNNDVSNRPQILKYRQIFNITANRSRDRELIYNIVNNISDNKEVIVLVEGIKLKLGKDINKFVKNFTIGKSIISAYGTVSNRYQRMLELKYRTERCYFIMNHVLDLKALFDEKELSFSMTKKESEIINQINKIIIEDPQDKLDLTINDVVIFLIQEALFCCSQLIKMIRLYNPGYVIGYSFIAQAHSRMGDWCQAYNNYRKIIDEHKYDKDLYNYDNHLKFLKGQKQTGKAAGNLDDWKKNKKKIENIIRIKKILDKDGVDEIKRIIKSNKEYFERDILKRTIAIKLVKQGNRNINANEIKLQISKFYYGHLDKLFKENQDSYSYRALKNWVKIPDKNSFVAGIEKLLGDESLIYLESKNHYETAIQYYYKMIQMHSDSKAYKDKLHEIYMLEDDYNDSMAHYTIASERLRINTGSVKDKIKKLNHIISESKLYVYSSYLTSADDNDLVEPDINTIRRYLEFFAKDIKEN